MSGIPVKVTITGEGEIRKLLRTAVGDLKEAVRDVLPLVAARLGKEIREEARRKLVLYKRLGYVKASAEAIDAYVEGLQVGQDPLVIKSSVLVLDDGVMMSTLQLERGTRSSKPCPHVTPVLEKYRMGLGPLLGEVAEEWVLVMNSKASGKGLPEAYDVV